MGTSPFVFSVQLLEDDFAEPSETFNLVLSAVSADVSIDPAFSRTTVTIADRDSKLTMCVCVCVHTMNPVTNRRL